MSVKKEQAQVALVKTSVSEGIEKVNEKLAGLQSVMETAYKTSGKVMTGYPKEVEKEEDPATLIKMYAAVTAKEEAYNNAADAIYGSEQHPVFKESDRVADDWRADIKLRVKVLRYKKTYDELTSIKKQFEELMDKEDKKAILMKRIAKLGN